MTRSETVAKRHEEERKRSKEIFEQLEQLDLRTCLLLDSNDEFFQYCGHYALRSLILYGNTILSHELVEKEGVKGAENILEEYLGVPVKIRLLKGDGSYEKDCYIAEASTVKGIDELPAPKMIDEKRGPDGEYLLVIKNKKKARKKRSKSVKLLEDAIFGKGMV